MGTASSEWEHPRSTRPPPPASAAPHSQVSLLDQPFGEEFFHALVHTGTEPIPFLRQGWGHLEDTEGLGIRPEYNLTRSISLVRKLGLRGGGLSGQLASSPTLLSR